MCPLRGAHGWETAFPEQRVNVESKGKRRGTTDIEDVGKWIEVGEM